MKKKEYIHKRIEPEKDKKRLNTFELGRKCGELYNFNQMLKQNNMTWTEYPTGYGRITHTPTQLYVQMEVSPLTRTQHKHYNLNKLNEKVLNHLYKLKLNITPVNTLI